MDEKIKGLLDDLEVLDTMSVPNEAVVRLRENLARIEEEKKELDKAAALLRNLISEKEKEDAPRMRQCSKFALELAQKYGKPLRELRELAKLFDDR